VKELELEGRLAELERSRMERIAREWLEVEKSRPEFFRGGVLKTRERSASLASSSTRAIDRMDKLSSGGHAIIDYKTGGNITPRRWDPPRPDEPQLTLYAVAAKEEVTVVAFAKVRPGEMRFMGYSRDDNAIPKVQRAKAWQPLLRDWKAESRTARSVVRGGRGGRRSEEGPHHLPLLAASRRSAACYQKDQRPDRRGIRRVKDGRRPGKPRST